MNTYNPENIEYKTPSMLVNNIRSSDLYYNPPPTLISHSLPDILDRIRDFLHIVPVFNY